MTYAIRVENVSKCYRIRHSDRVAYRTLREEMMQVAMLPWHLLRGRHPSTSEDFWVLKDVSFDVKFGDVVGVIGRNGAGKSTLLRILSRITKPTRGRVEMRGRVGSLLEVGTGFHPELTGRENIFLSGAILGMPRREIVRKFDEIVAFAEIERFLDTPVKRYSSGMYVRLAFSVAAHLDPDILIIDEVLAVGDAAFQRKCFQKLESQTAAGRAILLVSHSIATVRALCSHAVLLEGGALKIAGTVDSVVNEYFGAFHNRSAEVEIDPAGHDWNGGKQIRLKRIRLVNGAHGEFAVYWQQPIQLAVEFSVLEDVDNVSFGTGLRLSDGTFAFVVYNDDFGQPRWNLTRGDYQVEISMQNVLRPGVYALHFGACQNRVASQNLFAIDAVMLEVLDHTDDGQRDVGSNPGIVSGMRSEFSLAPSSSLTALRK